MYIILFIFIMSLLMAIHEAGHMFFSKLAKVPTKKFYLFALPFDVPSELRNHKIMDILKIKEVSFYTKLKCLYDRTIIKWKTSETEFGI